VFPVRPLELESYILFCISLIEHDLLNCITLAIYLSSKCCCSSLTCIFSFSAMIDSSAFLFSSISFLIILIYFCISSILTLSFFLSISIDSIYCIISSYVLPFSGDPPPVFVVFLMYSSYACFILRSNDPKFLSLLMISLNV